MMTSCESMIVATPTDMACVGTLFTSLSKNRELTATVSGVSVITRVRGRITGPALIARSVLAVGAAVVSPLGPAAAPQAPYNAGAAVQGFLTGYQTMDLLASLTFGIYLCHFAVIPVCYDLLDCAALPDWVRLAGMSVAAFAASALVVWAMSRWSVTRRVVM